MAVEVGFEPTHAVTRLSAFKADPFDLLGTLPCKFRHEKRTPDSVSFSQNCMQEGVYSRVDFVIRSHLQFIDTIIIKHP